MVVLYWSWLRTVIISNSPLRSGSGGSGWTVNRAFPLGVVKLPSRGPLGR